MNYQPNVEILRDLNFFLDTELAKFRALYEDQFHPEDRAAVKSVSLFL